MLRSNSAMKPDMRRVSGLYDETIRIHSRSGVSCERTNRGANSMQRHNSPPARLDHVVSVHKFNFTPQAETRSASGAFRPKKALENKRTKQEDPYKNTKKIENNPPGDRSMPKQTVFAWLAERNRHIRRNRSSATTALWSLTSSCGM